MIGLVGSLLGLADSAGAWSVGAVVLLLAVLARRTGRPGRRTTD
jgi:hypothetical protein